MRSRQRIPELKSLFKTIAKHEQQHFDMLENLLGGTLPQIKNHEPRAVKYEPQASHKGTQEEKEFDKFLCTDIIATEKYVATDYNNDLFYFCVHRSKKRPQRHHDRRTKSCGNDLEIQSRQ